MVLQRPVELARLIKSWQLTAGNFGGQVPRIISEWPTSLGIDERVALEHHRFLILDPISGIHAHSSSPDNHSGWARPALNFCASELVLRIAFQSLVGESLREPIGADFSFASAIVCFFDARPRTP